MELSYKGSFRRDYRNINNTELLKALKRKFDEIGKAKNLHQIQNLKKLRRYETFYRIEIKISDDKIYWILCVVSDYKIKFVRVKTEQFFKRTLRKYKR